jgi:RNA polymerase sigma-70 factor, ECF subfamily
MPRSRRGHGGRHAALERDPQERATPHQYPGPVPTVGETDDRLYRAMYEEHHGHLLTYAVRLTEGDIEDAEELVKEAMYRAWQDPGTFSRRPATLRPALTVLTRKAFVERQERHRRIERSLASEPHALVKQMASANIQRALRELSVAHRSVLIDSFYRGLSLDRIAAAHEIPVETVKSRLYYALRALRLALQDAPE